MLTKFILICLVLTAWADEEGPIVNTKYGKIKGFASKSSEGNVFHTFHNIPFGKPPIGSLRFKDPEEPEAWEGVRNGIQEHSRCSQPNIHLHLRRYEKEYLGHEDCLYMTIYTPNIEDDLLPVMFYIHGGGYIAGAGKLYRGHDLVDLNVVIVSINYRLGVLGFLSTEDEVISGNIGVKDQTMALKWVQENIEHFGGDPNQVTIFGESAGGAFVHFHVLSPVSKGLFHRAIIQSGNALSPWSYSHGQRGIALQLGAAVGCFTPAGILQQQSEHLLDCLQEVDAETLTMAYGNFMNWTFYPLNFGPRVDGQYLLDDPQTLLRTGKHIPVDIMIGLTKDDGSIITNSLFGENDFLQKLQQKFEYYGPVSLMLSHDDKDAELSRQVYQHYLKKDTVDVGDVEELTKLYTDRLFGVSTENVARLHRNQVYLYEFDYLGKQSFGSLYDMEFGKHWVMHTDELIYLFPPSEMGLKELESNDDLKMRRIMTTLWANFAKTGNPTPDDSLNFTWEPFSKDSQKHLVLKLTPEMKDHPETEGNKFWSSLPTRENSLLNGPEVTTDWEEEL